MSKRIISTTIIASFIALFGAVAPLTLSSSAYAAVDPATEIGNGTKAAGGGGKGSTSLQDGLKTVVNVLLYVLGAIAVIVIIIGGIRYTLSNGDSNQMSSAKNTILYAVVGLVVALLAYAIVNFIIASFA